MLLQVLLLVALYARAYDYDFVWTDHSEIEQGLLIRPPDRILAAFGEQTVTGQRVDVPGLGRSAGVRVVGAESGVGLDVLLHAGDHPDGAQ